MSQSQFAIKNDVPIHDTSGGEMPATDRVSLLVRRIRADLPVLKALPVGKVLLGLVTVGALGFAGAYFYNTRNREFRA